ncbi:retrovirus-related pol polyprotein from transposon TNT 1-94 [Tanacetum coccineum]
MTQIEADKTMLADSKLPTTFWAEAVNIACYVHNRVLVVKPHNKGLLYEIFRGFRTSALSFMRHLVSCYILNTLDYFRYSQDYIFNATVEDGSLFDSASKMLAMMEPTTSSDDGRRMMKDFVVIYHIARGPLEQNGSTRTRKMREVAGIEAIRLFLCPMPHSTDFVVYQMDVKSAFLYGKIEEEVYVCQPPGFKDPEFPDRVYKVEKALYGLHQAPRAWTARMTRKVVGFVISQDKHTRPDIIVAVWTSPFDLEAYTDSDYAGASLDRKSTTRGCQFLRSRLISWQCKKQTIVANSTTKAEYVAAASC